jgi:hypothetical protein
MSAKTTQGAKKTPPGIGVDSNGAPLIDPTQNVKDLTEAANLRQDDLRELNDRRIDAEIRVLSARLDGVEHRMIMRAEHAKEIRLLEADRLEKIRQVDVLAGNTAAERALVAIQTLATANTATAETLRNSAYETVVQQNARIAQLEKSSYEGAGKGSGTAKLWGFIFAGTGLALAAGGFVLTFLVVLAGVVVYAVRAGG